MYSVHRLGNSVCWRASIGCNLEHQQWPLQWQFSVIFTMSGKRGCFRDVELWHCQLCLSQTDLIPAPKSLPPPWSWPRTPCQPPRAISPMPHRAGLQTHSALPCLAMGLNPFPSPDITEELMLKAKFHTHLAPPDKHIQTLLSPSSWSWLSFYLISKLDSQHVMHQPLNLSCSETVLTPASLFLYWLVCEKLLQCE